MIKYLLPALTLFGIMLASRLLAEDVAPTPGPKDKIHYKKSKNLDLTSQTVEGKMARPETSLITASENLKTDGVLRLRENFIDKFAADVGEQVP